MRKFRLRSDLKRGVINGFELPLGLVASGVAPPTEGYTLDYTTGEGEEPDTYSFHVVVSHERLAAVIDRVFDLLPDEEVWGIVEIGSRDAYRSVDVFMAAEPITLGEFREGWRQYEPFLLEDGSIGAGANSEEPFVEVFVDQWKGLWIHTPLSMRDQIEEMLTDFGLIEVSQTWPEPSDGEADASEALEMRSVLAIEDEFSPDVEELLLQLRHVWGLELNVDPNSNIDEGGRSLGSTLWHAMIVVEAISDPNTGAYVSIWVTAESLARAEDLIDDVVTSQSEWRFVEIYTIDRIAFDERPEELADLPPRRDKTEIHLVEYDVWSSSADDGGDRNGEPPGE